MTGRVPEPNTTETSGPQVNLPLLVITTMTGTVALHVFVPALPGAARDLEATAFAAQLTITLFLCGLAGGQLVYGPLADRLGRRPVLLTSLGLYLAGLLLAVPAASIAWLVTARVLQSLGACGALVLGRTMVRDTSDARDMPGRLAVLMMCMTLTPTLAPALGGLIDGWLGWRAIFGVLAGLVALLLALSALTVPETRRAAAGPPAGGLAGYRRLLGSAKFRRYLVAGSCSGTSLYAFLAAAPFLYVEALSRSPQEVGLFCVVVSGGMVVGTALVRLVAGRVEVRRGARVGNAASLAAALALLGLAATGQITVLSLTAPLVLYAIGVGVAGPNIVAAAMNVEPDAAGSASGLYGFSQMAVGAVCTLAVGVWHDGTALPLAAVLVAASLTSAVALQRV